MTRSMIYEWASDNNKGRIGTTSGLPSTFSSVNQAHPVIPHRRDLLRHPAAPPGSPPPAGKEPTLPSRRNKGIMEGQSAPSQALPVSIEAYGNSIATPADAGDSSSSSSSSSPAVAKLRKLLFRRMLIGVKDGRYFLGLFHCIDKQGNIILQDAVEYRSARTSQPPTEQRCLGLILIPAACRSSCQVDCSVEEKMSLLCLDE
ncbi:hypothetical protein EJB05_41961, partial [Eragrostis curvula]